MLTSTGFVFLMQAGFALVEGGAVSRKNRNSMLIKNIYNVAITAVAFWLVGYGLGYGGPDYFVGQDKNIFASYGFEQVEKDHYVDWVINFALATVVIASFQGALAERTQLFAYLVVSAILAGFVYPIILAWTWGLGWLTEKGFHDFAGAGIVHLVGGTTALWGAWIVGERRALVRQREGQFHKHEVDVKSREVQAELDDLHTDFSKVAKKHFKGNEGELSRNNNAFIVLGALLVWASYIFFISSLTMFDERSASTAKNIQNMFIASGFSALLSVLLKRLANFYSPENHRAVKFDALTIYNGALIGMVAMLSLIHI